jgi:hypothetical protein
MKKKIFVFASLVLLSGALVSCGNTDKTSITSAELPLYINSVTSAGNVSLNFINGDTAIPYLSMENAITLLTAYYHSLSDSNFALSLSSDNHQYTLSRENGATAVFDFSGKKITFSDYDEFVRLSYSANGLDIFSTSGFDKTGKAAYLERESGGCFEKPAGEKTIDLGAYNIPLVEKDKVAYLPLATFSDLLLGCMNAAAVYNTKCVIVSSGQLKGDIAKLYYDAPTGNRSEALAQFTYDEMKLSLDCFYGLKEKHDITDFETYFTSTGLKSGLLSTDPKTAGASLAKLTMGYFADFHSGYDNNSFYLGESEKIVTPSVASPDVVDFYKMAATVTTARAQAYPNGCPGYEEIGDTAYVTFNQFTPAASDYYSVAPTATSSDTVGVIGYAQSQIFRSGSPVKNVVLDLSTNLGGDADAAIYTLSWMLGSSRAHLKEAFTGATSTNSYRCDTNYDREFDGKDDVSSLRLFCLSSPMSFSCGNWVPCALKESGKVTMLGQTSGGGACSVIPLALADGTFYQISGYRKLCTAKNGVYADIDDGAKPDYRIMNYEDFFNRKSLTAYINTLLYA